MTTFTESFDQADSRVLGPDLAWTKFTAVGVSPREPGGDDGATFAGEFGIDGGDRLDPAILNTSDSFNRTDSASTMGNTDQAYGGDAKTWFPQAGTWGISSNQAYPASSTAGAATVVNAGDQNMTMEVTISIVTAGCGVVWRFDDTSNYWRLEAGTPTTVYKKVAGVDTSVATFAALVDGDVVRVVNDGDDHTIYVNGVEVAQFTDTAFNFDNLYGLYAPSSTATRFEDFRIGQTFASYGNGWARADGAVGVQAMYAQAVVSAIDSDDYPIFYLGVDLDPAFAGPLDSSDDYFGMSGVWAVIEALWNPTVETGIAVYAWDAAADEFLYATITATPGTESFGYAVVDAIAEGDIVRLGYDPVSTQCVVTVNGVPMLTGTLDTTAMANPPMLGTYGGLGVEVYYSTHFRRIGRFTSRLDDFETGPLGDAPPPPYVPPDPVAGTLVATLYDKAYAERGPLQIVDNSAQWEEQRSDPGSGSVQIQAYSPAGVALARPKGHEFITFGRADGMGGMVDKWWTMLVDDDLKTRVGNTIAARKITVGGLGPLALYRDSEVYPTMGYGAFPLQLDMYYDWRHVDYDDSSWTAPTSIISMSDAKTPGAPDWGHSIFLVWSPFFPAGPAPFPDPDILWASTGSLTDAPLGKRRFRQHITLPFELTYVMWLAADNRAIAYLDGVELGGTNGGGGSPDTSGWVDAQSPIWFKASAGDHVLAVEAENLPRSDSVAGNPAGVAWNIFIPGYPLTLGMCIAHSNTADVVMDDGSADAPGMSPGMAWRLFVEKAQSYGDLPAVDISSFSDTKDSNEVDWPTPYPCISTKVLTDGLTFLREITGTYVDARADRDDPFRLLLYIKGTMNYVPAGVGFRPAVDQNVVGMEIRRDYKIANVLIGVTKFGYVEVSDAASVAANGRRPQRVELGSYDNPDEAVRVLTEMLARYSTVRDEIMVTIDGPLGYVDYDIGNTVPTVDSVDAPITERIMALAVRQSSTGRPITTPTVKDVFFYAALESP